MKEKLQEYALLAEVLGGVAVVVTLVFLVLETRQNTNAIQAQTYQSLTAELNEFRRHSTTSQLMDIREKNWEGGREALTRSERFIFSNSIQALWGIYESAFYAREKDVLGDLEWERFQNLICDNYNGPQGTEWWEDVGRAGITRTITRPFREYVESSC